MNIIDNVNPFSHTRYLQQTTWKYLGIRLYTWKYNDWIQLDTLWQMEKILIMSNFPSWSNVFKCRLQHRMLKYVRGLLWNEKKTTFNCPCFTGNVIINMYAFCTKCHFTIRNYSLTLSHIQQTYSRQLWNHIDTNMKYLYIRRVEKSCDKRGNCLIWAFSSFRYNDFKVFCCKGVRKRLFEGNC